MGADGRGAGRNEGRGNMVRMLNSVKKKSSQGQSQRVERERRK